MSFQVLNASQPVVVAEVLFGTQVVGQLQGADLRAAMGLYFSVPRTPMVYNLMVHVRDSLGCEAVTTAPRPVTVQ